MEGRYEHGGPHVINKICGQNRPYVKQHGRPKKTNVLDEIKAIKDLCIKLIMPVKQENPCWQRRWESRKFQLQD